ncbi:hypothetical protein VPH35_134587 [Triticum aestivum]
MELSRLPLVRLLCLLAGSSTTALPALLGMDRVRQQVDRANRRGPSIGLVMSYVEEDTALQVLAWRRFHIGSDRGVNVIYALTGERRLNAVVTVQTLLDVFSVSGIVYYGTAGSSNDSMSFGDVSVPKLVAYTGAWTWKQLWMVSAALVMVFVIVFRGVSDLAGGEPTWPSTSLMNLASINALKVAVEFITTIGRQMSTPSAQS